MARTGGILISHNASATLRLYGPVVLNRALCRIRSSSESDPGFHRLGTPDHPHDAQ